MKTLKSFLAVFTLFFICVGANAQTQPKNEQTLEVKTSAVCGMCKKSLEKAMAYEKGVKSSSLDVDSKVLTVVFDSRKTSPDNIRKAINETGYDADSKPASERAYKRLDDCCKKEAGAH
ncbi:heavy-metal-associated domain-containing protein [uncultured Pontibacter sp.]|uniref:heavy-metal-associated domain-containing protein n=1 Tax=uncultured Pontibacter sp. TaxID=453356 RepID=UPI00261AB6D7|nr:heavy-metal-associated domain-containing protein [uncultured Pontibacter sp.]